MGIILTSIFAIYFAIIALANLNRIRKAEKQDEEASQDFATNALANLNKTRKEKELDEQASQPE
jgi:uncharacterized membrane protein